MTLYNTFFTLIMSTSSEKDIRVAFGNLAITHSDINANVNISHFKPKILGAIDHFKGISHKRPNVDSIFDFITRTTASDITKEATRLGVTHKFLVPLTKLVTLITLIYKTKKAPKTIINLIVLSSSQHIHLLKPTSIHFALANI